MKKLICLLITILITASLAGCNDSENNLSNKAIEQGKLALANKEYDKALSSFELALNEGTDDREVREIYDIIKKYKEAQEYLDKEDTEKAEKTLNEINSAYSRYAIKEDIDQLKNDIENMAEGGVLKTEESPKEDEKALKDTNKKVDSESSNKDVKEEKVNKVETSTETKLETKPTVKSRKDEYIRKMDNLEQSLPDMNYAYNSGSDEEIIDAETVRYQGWDNLLNEIWGVLKSQLPENEMNEIVKVQRQWIENKENTAIDNSIEYDDGSDESITYISTLSELTRDRCYELVELYMK